MASVPGSPAANAERAAAALAAHPDVKIAVFPELFLGGYELARLAGSARPADCAELRTIAEAAEAVSTAVAVGFAERNTDGTFSNSVACIDRDGSLAAVYRKTQLFGAEREAFRAGDALVVVRLAGLAVALLVCFDVEFPEPARQLARAGAEEELLVALVARPGTDDERVDYLRHLPDPLDIIGGNV